MRHVLIAAAVLAVGGFFASGPALAQQGAPLYQPGGPEQIAGWCKVVSSHNFGADAYGYYQPCPGASMAYAPKREHHR